MSGRRPCRPTAAGRADNRLTNRFRCGGQFSLVPSLGRYHRPHGGIFHPPGHQWSVFPGQPLSGSASVRLRGRGAGRRHPDRTVSARAHGTDTRVTRPRRSRIRRLAGLLVLAALLWFLLGSAGLAVWLGVVVADLLGAPPRWLLGAAVALLVLAPVAVLLDGLPTPSTISASFARDHWVADSFIKAGVALLVVGVLREPRASPGDGTPTNASHPANDAAASHSVASNGSFSATRPEVPGQDVDQE
jgi:hypothetical protein